jgi:hypothetical protein
MGPQLQNFTYLEGMQNFYFATTVDAYRITGNFCGNLISGGSQHNQFNGKKNT